MALADLGGERREPLEVGGQPLRGVAAGPAPRPRPGSRSQALAERRRWRPPPPASVMLCSCTASSVLEAVAELGEGDLGRRPSDGRPEGDLLQPAQGVDHPLRGQHAAVVVPEDQLGALPERAQRLDRGDRRGAPAPGRAAPGWRAAWSGASRPRLLVLERDDVQVEAAALVHQPLEDRPAAGPGATSGCSERPTMRSLTRCERAKSSRAWAGRSDLRRTTSAPSSRAFSMLASRWRWASESIRSGASSGVST